MINKYLKWYKKMINKYLKWSLIATGAVAAVAAVYFLTKGKGTTAIGGAANPTGGVLNEGEKTYAGVLHEGEKTYAGVKESEIEALMASKFPSENVSKLMNHLRNGKVLRTDQYANMTLKEFADAILKRDTINGVFKTVNFSTPKGLVVGLLLGDAYNQKVISDQDKTTYYNLVRGL